jgi:hypothetical protein
MSVADAKSVKSVKAKADKKKEDKPEKSKKEVKKAPVNEDSLSSFTSEDAKPGKLPLTL